MNMYQELVQRYNSTINDQYNDFIIRIDGSKTKPFSIINEYIEYLKFTDKYASVFTKDELCDFSDLHFAPSLKKYSNYFLKYILNFLTSNKPFFYKVLGEITINDYHTEILNIRQLFLGNTIVDNEMIQVFKKFFKKLEKISFHDCVIEKNCSFRELNCDLHFEGCEIKSTNSYNYCEQSIEFLDCKIDKITNAVINSNNIRISGKECNDYMLTLLFLKCHFPNLESLIIGSKLERCEIDNSINYNSCLYFMPYSCPKLMDLFIQGSVNSFDFLYHFNKLTSCEIRSVDDSIGPYEIYNPYITDELERKEIVNKSKRNIETSLDINLALYDRLAQILKALSCINFFDEEKNLYLYQKTPLEILNPLRCFREQKVNYYYSYDSINGILKLHFDHAGDYKLVNDNFYYIIM